MKTYRQYRELLTKHRIKLKELSLVQIDNICRAMEDLERETEQSKISFSPITKGIKAV